MDQNEVLGKIHLIISSNLEKIQLRKNAVVFFFSIYDCGWPTEVSNSPRFNTFVKFMIIVGIIFKHEATEGVL